MTKRQGWLVIGTLWVIAANAINAPISYLYIATAVIMFGIAVVEGD